MLVTNSFVFAFCWVTVFFWFKYHCRFPCNGMQSTYINIQHPPLTASWITSRQSQTSISCCKVTTLFEKYSLLSQQHHLPSTYLSSRFIKEFSVSPRIRNISFIFPRPSNLFVNQFQNLGAPKSPKFDSISFYKIPTYIATIFYLLLL